MEDEIKLQLEIEKLKVEIKNEKLPIYKKLSFYASLSPIIVSLVAILYSLSTGFFDNESRLLDLKKENLKNEINIFESKRDSLLGMIKSLVIEKDSILIDNKNYMKQNQKLKMLSDDLVKKQNKLNSIISNIKDSVIVKQKKYDELFSQYDKLKNDKESLKIKIKELRVAINPQLENNKETEQIFNDILKILDENLGGGFSSSSMLLLFSH